PGADEYVGQAISPTEFAEKFGANRSDADTVAKSLRKYGLKVEDLSLTTRSMKVTGTAAAMEAAFKPNMVMLRSTRSSQREFRGRQGPIMIPSELKGIVTGVFGLDQRRMARRKKAPMAAKAVTLQPLTPSDLEARYRFPPGDGEIGRASC